MCSPNRQIRITVNISIYMVVGIIGNELVGLGMLERSSSVNTE